MTKGHRTAGTSGHNGDALRVPELVAHVTIALSRHVRYLHQEGLPVPPEVEDLATFLDRLARLRQGPPMVAEDPGNAQYAGMPDRLLVTKSEAAERLGVSVRTIERLVATGRLPQVQVERLARFRVSDLEAYVEGLTSRRPAGDATAPPDQKDVKRNVSSR